MMQKDGEKQGRFMFVNLDDYIPQDHLLRAIRKSIDFSFIYDKVSHLYSEVGRPSIDPVLLIKMLLLGYLYGIPSERRLEEEVRLNLAYRWFLGMDMGDAAPDHSTFSQNRRRRFKKSGIFQGLFDHIVSLCIDKGLVTGEVIVTDSTHVKASASKSKVEKIIVKKTPSAYLLELEKEAQRLEAELQAGREESGQKKRRKKTNPKERKVVTEVISKSTTDPDAGLMKRPGKPTGFYYLGHTSIDPKHGIITDIHVTPGNINDQQPYIERLKIQEEKFPFKIKKVGADRGYDYAEVHYGLERLDIEGYISPFKRVSNHESIDKREFSYDTTTDMYICPEGKCLKFTHIYRGKGNRVNKIYSARSENCKNCPRRKECFGGKARHRIISRPLFQEVFESNNNRSETLEYKRIQRLRRIWCEGTFGTLKQRHNLRSTYRRGIENVQEQCLMSALAMNIKRMVKALR